MVAEEQEFPPPRQSSGSRRQLPGTATPVIGSQRSASKHRDQRMDPGRQDTACGCKQTHLPELMWPLLLCHLPGLPHPPGSFRQTSLGSLARWICGTASFSRMVSHLSNQKLAAFHEYLLIIQLEASPGNLFMNANSWPHTRPMIKTFWEGLSSLCTDKFSQGF